MLDEQRLRGLEKNTIKNFFLLLIEWTEKYNSYEADKVGSLYRDVLLKSRIDENKVSLIKGILHDYFVTLQDTLRGIYILQKILCKMMPCFVEQYYDENDIYFPECIYDSDELLDMLRENTLKFLDRVKPEIGQFIEYSRLQSFVKYSIVKNESHFRPTFDSFPIEQELIDYFSTNRDRHNIQPFLDKFVIANYNGDTDEEKIETMMADIRKHFASIKFYTRFLKECFVHDDDGKTLGEYLKNNHLPHNG